MLLLGFLRSAAQLLRKGPVPSVGATKRHRGAASDDEDGPGEGAARLDAAGPVSSRGSILITLRNVPPYTLWQVIFISSFAGWADELHKGPAQAGEKSAAASHGRRASEPSLRPVEIICLRPRAVEGLRAPDDEGREGAWNWDDGPRWRGPHLGVLCNEPGQDAVDRRRCAVSTEAF